MKYLKVFVNFAEVTEALTDAEIGRLFRAMMEYASTGTLPDLRGNERYAWGAAKLSIDQQSESYANKVSGAEKAREKRSDIRANQNDINTENLISTQVKDKNKKDKEIPTNVGTKKSSAFVAPTVEEVEARCREMGYKRTSPVAFVSHYESVGWKVGKNPMKDWKAALAGWEAREQQFRSVARDEPKRKKNAALNYEQTPISKTDFDKLIVDLS